jgi:hypothetical protein
MRMLCSLLIAYQDCVLLQMGRAVLLALAITFLMVAVQGQQNVTECHDAVCAWMDEKICPGEFFPKEPSVGRCCAYCLVIVGKSVSIIVFHSFVTVSLNYRVIIFSGPNSWLLHRPCRVMVGSTVLSVIQIRLEARSTLSRCVYCSQYCFLAHCI